jgi:transcriptional regulator with XRE-family HTH domain
VSDANPLVSQAELSGKLRQLRVRAGKTLEDAAEILEVSAATISRIETEQRVPRARDVRELARAFGADEAEVERLAGLVQPSRQIQWTKRYPVIDDDYARYIAYEEAATGIDELEIITVPALLQTADYGREYLFKTLDLYNAQRPPEKDVAQRIEVRGLRQDHLLARSGVRFQIILREECLDQEVGGPAVMKGQLAFLLTAAEWSFMDLRVVSELPASEGLLGATSAFTLLRLPQTQISDVVYSDDWQGQRFLEEEELVQRHERLFQHFWNRALDRAKSKEFIEGKLRAL